MAYAVADIHLGAVVLLIHWPAARKHHYEPSSVAGRTDTVTSAWRMHIAISRVSVTMMEAAAHGVRGRGCKPRRPCSVNPPARTCRSVLLTLPLRTNSRCMYHPELLTQTK